MLNRAAWLARIVFMAAAIVTVVGCSGEPLSTREKGTFLGTGIGAATGAIIGAAVGAPLAGATSKWANPINYDGVMVSFDSHHESGSKSLLDGLTVPAGQTAVQDLKMALDDIFNHPNVGPFIGKQLIQQLHDAGIA